LLREQHRFGGLDFVLQNLSDLPPKVEEEIKSHVSKFGRVHVLTATNWLASSCKAYQVSAAEDAKEKEIQKPT
jgi:hypothetical protein